MLNGDGHFGGSRKSCIDHVSDKHKQPSWQWHRLVGFLSGYILVCIVLLHKFKMFSMEKEVYTEKTNEDVIIFTE